MSDRKDDSHLVKSVLGLLYEMEEGVVIVGMILSQHFLNSFLFFIF